MGFLFENVKETSPQEPKPQVTSPEIELQTPASIIQDQFETKIDGLNIRMILKRYLRQTLREILTEDRDMDKIFLFEIREILQKVQKKYDESDFPEFLEVLNELFLICVDKEMSIEKIQSPNIIQAEIEIEPVQEQPDRTVGSLFIRAIQRQALNRLLNFNNLD